MTDKFDPKAEILNLAAETMALQAMLFSLIVEIRRANVSQDLTDRVFDLAALIVETTAIKAGKSADPRHTVKAVKIVEETREQVDLAG